MRFVVTADESCMHNYNMSFMAGFLSCVPRDVLPNKVVEYIEKHFFSPAPNTHGVAEVAILALRKIEACLTAYGHEVTVAIPQEAEKFEADAFLVSTMDPFGIGPATTTMIGLAGGDMSFNKFFFRRLVTKIRAAHPNAKIIAGGPGAWEFEIFPEAIEELGIDCVFNGAVESAPQEFWAAESVSRLPKSYQPPPATLRPDPCPITGPTFWGMVEISRGCGRGCQFCDFELMSGFKWLPKEFILSEARLNAASPLATNITLLSEDTLRYGTPRGEWKPTGEIAELVKELAKLDKPLGFTHCCLATALANPKVTEEVSYHAGLDEKHLSGFQTGIESGSPKIIERYMKGKLKPWSPEDWPEVVEQGMAVMIDNYIIPHATLVMGLAGETAEDTLKTIELVDRLKGYPSLILPLFFVPLSVLKDRMFIADMMTPEQKELLTVSMRHTSRWAQQLPNWSGSLRLMDRFVFTTGAEYSFEYMKCLNRENIGMGKTATLVAKAMARSGWNLVAHGEPELEYYRQTKREYPVLERIGENMPKEEIVVMNMANTANSKSCGCGMGGFSFISGPVLEKLFGKKIKPQISLK